MQNCDIKGKGRREKKVWQRPVKSKRGKKEEEREKKT